MEINRLIRVLEGIAEKSKGEDLFIKIHNSEGGISSPDASEFEYYNDHSDRMMTIDGK